MPEGPATPGPPAGPTDGFETALGSKQRSLAGKADALPRVMFGATIAMCVIIIACLGIVFWISFIEGEPDAEYVYTLRNYVSVTLDSRTYEVLWNTLGFAFCSLAVAFFFGIPAAWLVERTNLPGKTIVFTLMTIGLLMPGFAAAMGWLFLMHPRIGLLNTLLIGVLGLAEAPFDISSILGMGWVQGLNLAPLSFIMTAAVFRAMDPALEESAQMSGARASRVMGAITLPLAWPGILAAGIYIFTIGFAAFDVPAILGWGNRIFTFSTFLYLLTSPQDVLPQYGLAAALSGVIVVLAGLMGLVVCAHAATRSTLRRYHRQGLPSAHERPRSLDVDRLGLSRHLLRALQAGADPAGDLGLAAAVLHVPRQVRLRPR